MKNKYNEVEVKDNMKIESDENGEEVVKEVRQTKAKIVSKAPKKVKRNLATRLVSGLLGPEGLPSIGQYVNDEIIVPAIKNIIVDAVTSGINMVMYGENKRNGGGGGYRPTSGYRPQSNYKPNTSYNSHYQPGPSTSPERKSVRPNIRHGVADYVIEDRREAAELLVTLTETADRYDTVSVADYYDMLGVEAEYTDHNYGWTFDSITRASVVPTRGGYVIKFPPVEVI